MRDNLKDIIRSNLLEGQILLDLSVNSGRDYVRIVIDSEDNVTLSDTTILSRKLKLLEEFNDQLAEFYRLEISTPGIDRALEFPFQYRKNIDRKINIKTLKNGNQKTLKGKIIKASDEYVSVSSRSGNITNISYDSIKSAKIKLSFK